MHVLFVCTGNVCRSPTAERLAAAYGARLKIPDFTTSSAGTRAVIGHPIHPDAALVLKELGGDPSGFVARQITPKIASGADLILTMTKSHRDAVLEFAPHRLNCTFSITEAAGLISNLGAEAIADLAVLRPHLGQSRVTDITDPIGQDVDVFSAIGSQIADLLQRILPLCRSSSNPSDASQ